MPTGFLLRTLRRLADRGEVRETSDGLYTLTALGVAEAERVTRLHRLWELYLMKKLEIHNQTELVKFALRRGLIPWS